MRKTQRPVYLFLLAVVLLNTLLWLDSFDRYLSSRYHITLSATLPERAFFVSHQTQALIANAQQFINTKLTQFQGSAQHNSSLDLPKLTAKVNAVSTAATPKTEIAHDTPATASAVPAPVAPVAPAPVASVPTAPVAVAPVPVASAPTAPVAVAPVPVASAPTAPVPAAPAPVASVAIAPVAVAPVAIAPVAVAPVAVAPVAVAPALVAAPAKAPSAPTAPPLSPTPTQTPAPTATVLPKSSTAPVAAVSSATTSTSKETAPTALPKVLFAGDSMMQGVAPLVINQLRKENPKGIFVDLSAQSTGLTVRRYFDWPTKIKDETLNRGFELIAVFLGPNDPWDIYEGAKRFAFGTPEWEDKYRDRVIEVMQFAQDKKVHVIWIGLPNMKEDRVKRGAVVQNKIFKEQASLFNFDYLSTEDFLGGLDEPFKKFIDEPGKGQVMLRADDGIHFTQAGLRLISARLYELIKKQAKPSATSP
jgi:hypothetical protein